MSLNQREVGNDTQPRIGPVRWMLNFWKLAVCLGIIVLAGPLPAAERDAANYVGIQACSVCHRSIMTDADNGNQFAQWQAGPHAEAFDVLRKPAAKAIGKKLGVANPSKSGKCLRCHSTAYNFTETIATEAIKPEDGVVCES